MFLEDFLQREPTSQYDPTGGNTQPEVTLDLGELVLLKATNARWFGFPSDLRRHFENVFPAQPANIRCNFSRTIPDLRI